MDGGKGGGGGGEGETQSRGREKGETQPRGRGERGGNSTWGEIPGRPYLCPDYMYLRMDVANPINISCTMEEMKLLCTT